jgi:hypothetical protein
MKDSPKVAPKVEKCQGSSILKYESLNAKDLLKL